jgi:cytochrome c-type biogenesis protein CcmF
VTGFGRAILVLGLLLSVYAVFAALRGTGGGGREWVSSARHAVYALATLLTLAVVVLEASYLRSDFSFGLVVDDSSTTTPTFYKMIALWPSPLSARRRVSSLRAARLGRELSRA